MIQVFVVVENLEIEKDIPELSLYRGEALIPLLNTHIIDWQGKGMFDEFYGRPIFFEQFEAEKDITDRQYGYMIHGNIGSFLALGTWLVKDSSVFTHNAVLYNSDSNFSSRNKKSDFIFDSKGDFTQTFFSRDEMLLSHRYYSLIEDFMRIESDIDKVESERANISSTSLMDYLKTNKITRAMDFIYKARTTSNILEKISWYIVALECFFNDGSSGDLSFKLRSWVPHFLETDIDKRLEIYNIIKSGYNIRSRYLHGGLIDKKDNKREISSKISSDLDDILRRVLIILLEDQESRNMIQDPKLFQNYFINAVLK